MEHWRAKFDAALRQYVRPGQRVGIATSGGPDSQALLHLTAGSRAELGLAGIVAIGVNHGLRPEARGELKVAATLAAQLDVPFVGLDVVVDRRNNVLAAARRARYAALHEHARIASLDWVLVGHSATDQVETVLMRLARGCGVTGATGMRRRRGKLLRPLLDATRSDLRAYLDAHGIAYASDPSNENPRTARAVLRARVLPGLRELGFDIEQSFTRFVALARADDLALDGWADAALNGATGPVGGLVLAALTPLPLAVQRRVLRRWLARAGLPVGGTTVQRLHRLLGKASTSLSVGGHQVRIERGHLWPPLVAGYDVPIEIPGRTDLAALGMALVARIEEHATRADVLARVGAAAGRLVAFDAQRTHFDLHARSCKPGDRLQPFGVQGHTKVGDLFTDAKIPRALRPLWPLVLNGEELLWVVGLRRGAGAPLQQEVQRVLTLEVDGVLPWGASHD